MATDYPEMCLTCRYFSPGLKNNCGRVFKAQVRVGPRGGDIDIEILPGMVPETHEEKLKNYLAKVFEWMSAVLEKCPIWDEIAVEMTENPEKKDCPGRDASRNPYLRVVK